MEWQKFNILLKHIEIIFGLWILTRLVYVLFLVGIQVKDTQIVIENLLKIMEAMAKKFRVAL